MTKEEFLSFYEPILVGAHVEGFRLSGQFPVLEMCNTNENKKIEFHIDCRIFSNSKELNDLVNLFSNYNKEIYETAFFIGINLKSVLSIGFSNEGNLEILFSNGILLTFKIIDNWVEPLNISIMKEDKYLTGCRFYNDGTIGK